MITVYKHTKKISIVIISILFMFTSHAAKSEVKHVFELFTSQSCYSCPPAEELLGKLIERYDDALCLEFHVDYWNTIVYGSEGQWVDPYSDASYSQRQKSYNDLSTLSGRKGVYTPQMIVDGQYAFVGSKVPRAHLRMAKKSGLVLSAVAEINESGTVRVQLDGDHSDSAEVWLLSYDKLQTTEIPTGENHGKTLDNYNIVRTMKSIGQWNGESLEIVAEAGELSENQNCAVIVQKIDASNHIVLGPILGAADCTSV